MQVFETILDIDEEWTSACDEIDNRYHKEEGEIIHKRKRCLMVFTIALVVISIAVGIVVGRTVFAHEVYGLHTVCYTTDTGNCYHASSCRYLWASRHLTNVYRAKKAGFVACSQCSVGKLDLSIKSEYGWGILACLIVIVPIPIILLKKKYDASIDKAAEETQKEKTALDRRYANQIINLIRKYGVLRIVDAPSEVMLQNGILSSPIDSYYRYVTYSGKCYHSNPYCCGKAMKSSFQRVWAYDCAKLFPCSKCSTIVHVPAWYTQYKKLQKIKTKCESVNQ